MADRRTDEELVADSLRDPAAFGVLYRRHARDVLAFHARRVPAQVAADLTAETWAAALIGLGSYDPERGEVRAWLFGIARRALTDFHRLSVVEERARARLKMERLVLTDLELERVHGLSEEGVSAVIVEVLPDEQADAVRARVLDGRSYADIAAAGDLTEAAARQRVSRGLRLLRQRLERGGTL